MFLKNPLIFVLVSNLIFAQIIEISPNLFYSYKSDSEDYYSKNKLINNLELGASINYSSQNLKIYTYIAYNLIEGHSEKYSNFTTSPALDWIKKDPGLGKDFQNYYIADMSLVYGDSTSNIYINKLRRHWGPGVRSLFISKKAPSFPHLGFYKQLTSMFKFEYFHGSLQSNIIDDNYNNFYSSGKTKQVARNIVAHRLKIEPSNTINISLNELVIYSNRSVEWTYMMPFIPFFPLQNYLNDIDNILISLDFEYMLSLNKKLYSSFLIDEWTPPNTFRKKNHNWFGYLIGIDFKNLYFNQDELSFEFIWTDHRVYNHRFESNDIYSWDYPIGFWAGPHAQEYFLSYKITFNNKEINLLASNAKRGEVTDDMKTIKYNDNEYDGTYERFDTNPSICNDCIGTLELRNKFSISLLNRINKNLNINFKYTYIYWENAGFDPKYPIIDIYLPNLVKNSFSLDIFYKFN